MARPRNMLNGNQDIALELGPGVMKVVVVGDPYCGKTRFIRAFYDHHEPGKIWSHHGVRVYPCEYKINNTYGRVAIFEIPGENDFYEELRTPHYNDADVIVFMYAIDIPTSYESLIDTWLLEVMGQIESNMKPIVVVGNKRDLRDDPDVVECLAIENETPVTFEQGQNLLVHNEIRDFVECCSYDLEEVNEAFNVILRFGLYSE